MLIHSISLALQAIVLIYLIGKVNKQRKSIIYLYTHLNRLLDSTIDIAKSLDKVTKEMKKK